MTKDSVKIILKQFKEGNISEEEMVTILEDLYNKNYYYPYYYTPYYNNTITEPINFKTTCSIKQ